MRVLHALILPESSVEPSNIDSTHKIDHYHQQCSVQTNYVHSARITIVKFTLTKSSIDASALKADISCGTLQSLINHQRVSRSRRRIPFDPNVDDRIVLDYNLENTKNCTRTYFRVVHTTHSVRSKRRPPHKHVFVDYADRVALCAPADRPQLNVQLRTATAPSNQVPITNASIIDTHSASMPISHARTISRNDTLPDDESDMFVHGGVNSTHSSPTAATLVMSVHSPLASPLHATLHPASFPCCTPPALASLAHASALASLAHASLHRFPCCTPLCTSLPCCTPLCTRFPRSIFLCTPLPSLHASLHSLPLLHATLHPASLAARHSAPRFPRSTPLCTPLPSLHTSLHSAFLAPRLCIRFPSLHASLHRFPCCTPPSALASLAPFAPLSALASLLHASAPASLAPRLSALASLLHASCTRFPLLHATLHSRSPATLHPLPSLHASLHSRFPAPHLSAPRFPAPCLCTRFPAHASVTPRFPAPRLSALRFPAPRLSALRFPAPRLLCTLASLAPRSLHSASPRPMPPSALASLCCTPLCTPLSLLHASLHSRPSLHATPRFPRCTPLLCTAFLAPRLSAPALPTATQTYPDISFSARDPISFDVRLFET
ncbi:hypothetical protein BLNAU_15258 [Blattamonas nauphoetae]|uniref:Ubiquitin-like domain-containing protein n=1 Tax=Blattamonas nauphoetae TaxID=2049346 RepID=A0ABQ9XB72_9EUKA|nr:hypothetical protein BLNAU_15258 [Blattamonas nauphoetae]